MMFHGRMVFLVYTAVLFAPCETIVKPFNESYKTMINKNKQTQSGQFFTKDNQANPIVLEWEIIHSISAKFNEKIRGLSFVFVSSYAEQELDFARKHPEAVSQEYFLQTLAPLFSDMNDIDWKMVEQEINKILQHFFATTDFAQFVDIADTNIFVEAKNQDTGELLGAIQFLISPKFEQYHVRSCYFGVASNASDRGIELLLMSSIFMIAPKTTRIFLHTRATNEKMLSLYHAWDFRQFSGKLKNWPDLEYTANKSHILQDTARMIVR